MPAEILCINFPDTDKTFAIVRPNSYKDLILRSTSLFNLGNSLRQNEEEIFFETLDFGLDKVVELLPEVWDELGLGILKCLYVRVRKIGTGPSSLPKKCTVRSTSLQMIPLSCPSMSLLRKTNNTGRHSTPGARTQSVQKVVKPAERPQKDSRIDDDSETTTVGYRGKYQVYEGSGDENPTTEGEEEEEEEELSTSEDNKEDLREGSRTERSRASLQTQGSTGRIRPMKRKSELGQYHEVSQSQDSQPNSQATKTSTDSDDAILITIQYGSNEATFKARSHHLISKVMDRACRHFGVDPTHTKLQLVSADNDSDILETSDCALKDTMGGLGVEQGDAFILADV